MHQRKGGLELNEFIVIVHFFDVSHQGYSAHRGGRLACSCCWSLAQKRDFAIGFDVIRVK